MEPRKATKKLFKPVNNKRTFEEVSREIKGLILEGTLKPGDRLPCEKELASQFNVGRQTIREALRILELSGFLTVMKGGTGGPCIKDTILNSLSNLFLDAMKMGKVSIEELTLARMEIEKPVLHHAMENADDSDIAALQENIAKAKQKLEKGLMATEENADFHKLLAKASKNYVFYIMIESIMALLTDLRATWPPDIHRSSMVLSYNEQILKAVVAHNEKAAAKLVDELSRKTLSYFPKTFPRSHE
jgi:GntR family transcriptional regulator, transcriptional repressor for pyruvate dehydrogenase complex